MTAAVFPRRTPRRLKSIIFSISTGPPGASRAPSCGMYTISGSLNLFWTDAAGNWLPKRKSCLSTAETSSLFPAESVMCSIIPTVAVNGFRLNFP